MIRKVLLAGVAALSVLSASAAVAGSPWTEADGKNVVFIALKKITCGTVRFVVWLPYDMAAQKQLDFYRITPLLDTPITGKITTVDGDLFLDGKKCVDWPGPES